LGITIFNLKWVTNQMMTNQGILISIAGVQHRSSQSDSLAIQFRGISGRPNFWGKDGIDLRENLNRKP